MKTASNIDIGKFDQVVKPDEPLQASSAAALRETFTELLEKSDGPTSVLLDLRDQANIDSCGISLVIGLFKDLRQQQRELTVAIGHAFVAKVFTSMQLHRHLDLVHVTN